MQDTNTKNYGVGSIYAFLLGCLGLVTVTILDQFYWHIGILTEGWPDFSQRYLIRSVVIGVLLAFVFWAWVRRKRSRLILINKNRIHLEKFGIGGSLCASVLFLFLFIFKPAVFSVLSLEDRPIEWGSALLLFNGCILFLVFFFKCRPNANIPKVTRLSFLLLFLVLFVIAMEEVSWFQRVLKMKPPKIFWGNFQGEMNLHNFATDYFENIYYFGVFLFLVVLPFMHWLFPFPSRYHYPRLFIARPFIALIGTIPCAYNFDMWNISFMQISFFWSIAILFSFAIFCDNQNERYVILSALILIILTQVVFLAYGKNFVRIWEVTEYKEFHIALLLFLYSLDVGTSVSRVYPPKSH